MDSPDTIRIQTFENGLVLVGEPMPWLESAAFSIHVPAGSRFDPEDKVGIANFVCEMVQRGAGALDSRGYIEQLELLGVDYSSSASTYATHFSGALCADQLEPALAVYADVLQRPHLKESELEDARQVCYQEIGALEDDLYQQVMNRLSLNYFGQPDGRDGHGTIASVGRIGIDDIRRFFQTRYLPNGTIIGVAGRIDWDALCRTVDRLFGDWQPGTTDAPPTVPGRHGVEHIPYQSQQTHIALAFPSIPPGHDDYYLANGVVGILSGGMSSRLFLEVREKRGLCYTVFATQTVTRDRGGIVCYSGTAADRAQETLDVIVQQLDRLPAGIDDRELERLKVQVRSTLVMRQESCRGRAGALVSDYFYLGRVRTLDEINARYNALTVDSMNRFLADNPPGPYDLVTMGEAPLEIHRDGISPASTG